MAELNFKEVEEVVQSMLDVVSSMVPIGGQSNQSQSKCCKQFDFKSNSKLINIQEVENITCEVLLDLDTCGLVRDCDPYLKERLNEGYAKDSNESEANQKTVKCCSCGKVISSTSQGYLSNFGDETAALCSEQCLLKHEIDHEPVSRCFQCKKFLRVKGCDSIFYYWQTMEFCSIDCIEKLQLSWGRRCANCNSVVPKASLGKYSVRFGNVIKQFCFGICLETYKKSLKVCTFCQMDLKKSSSICISHIGSGEKRRTREFCDAVCRELYQIMINSRGAGAKDVSTSLPCSQCQRMIEKMNSIEIENRGKRYIICCSFCLSAFKYTHKVTKIICERCFKFGWSIRSLTILHYSGITKLFCSKKCLNMFVLKIRKIVPCLACNVKKYNFDFIERYDSSSSDSKLFCSLHCLNMFYQSTYSSGPSMKEAKCDFCSNSLSPQYCLTISDNSFKHFCSYNCVINSQQKFDKSLFKPKIMPHQPRQLHQTQHHLTTTASFSCSTSSHTPTSASLHIPSVNLIQPPQFKMPTYQPLVHPSLINKSPIKLKRKLNLPLLPFTSTPVPSVSISSTNSSPTITTSAKTLWTPSSKITNRRSTNTSVTNSLSSSVSYNNKNSIKNQKESPVNSNQSIVQKILLNTSPVVETANANEISSRNQYIVKKICNKDGSGHKEVLMKIASPKFVTNKMTMYKASTRTKACSCKPIMISSQTQTLNLSCSEKVKLIPIPVPLFMPIPVNNVFPLPFPIPLPVPILLSTLSSLHQSQSDMSSASISVNPDSLTTQQSVKDSSHISVSSPSVISQRFDDLVNDLDEDFFPQLNLEANENVNEAKKKAFQELVTNKRLKSSCDFESKHSDKCLSSSPICDTLSSSSSSSYSKSCSTKSLLSSKFSHKSVVNSKSCGSSLDSSSAQLVKVNKNKDSKNQFNCNTDFEVTTSSLEEISNQIKMDQVNSNKEDNLSTPRKRLKRLNTKHRE